MTASLRLARNPAAVEDSSPQPTSAEGPVPGYVTLSSAGLQLIITTAQREAYVACLTETGPDPRKAQYLTPEHAERLIAKFRKRYEQQAAEKYPL